MSSLNVDLKWLRRAALGLGAAVVLFVLLWRLMVDEDWLMRMDRLQRHQARVETLRSLMGADTWEEKAHEAGFSSGYVLFAVDDEGNLVPGESPASSPLGVDWGRSRVVQVTKRQVSLVPPAIFFKADQCVRIGKILTFERGRPDRIRLCRVGGRLVQVALLSAAGDGLVFCLGVSRQ